MKWIETPDAYLVHSHCNGNDGTNLGWVAELISVSEKTYYQAYICNGYESAGYLGHYKTPRLAQMAVERELLKRWFRYEWIKLPVMFDGLYVDNRLIATTAGKTKPAILARAKREFLSEL